MAFDFKKTTDLVVGGLTRPQETWASYLGENPGWQQTLIVLTGPMIVANVVLSLLLSRIMGTMSPFGLAGNWFGALFLSLLMAAVGIAITSLVFCFLSGVFGGKPNFSRSFAAVSLAAIPAWVATVIGAAIPWIGGLIGLAGAIVTLVFLYRIIPLALEVPDGKRVLHFAVSLVAVLVINMIIASVLGVGRMGQAASAYDLGDRSSGELRPSGMFGEIGRQADLMAAASADSYDPPADGRVSREQAEWVAEVLEKSRAIRQEEVAKLEQMSKEMEGKEKPSASDMAKMYQGMGSAMSLNNVEMEVVKSGGGNWAEYQWVQTQLRNARMQGGEGSDALAYNFERYQEIKDRLE